MKANEMSCDQCGEIDVLLRVSGCPDCGQDRVETARALGKRPAQLQPRVDFMPNSLCRECCPSGHQTRCFEERSDAPDVDARGNCYSDADPGL